MFLANLILLLALIPAPFDLIRNFEASYTLIEDVNGVAIGAHITLDWELTQPADQMVVFRGKDVHSVLPGEATTWSIEETVFGEYQYSVGYRMDWPNRPPLFLQWETVIFEFGNLSWEKPASGCDGYVVYVSDTEGWAYTVPPYPVEGEDTLELALADMIDLGMIEVGIPVWISMASYRDTGSGLTVSERSDQIALTASEYVIHVLPYGPVEPPTNINGGW